MRPDAEVRAALDLAAGGRTSTEISTRLGIPRSTVRYWLADSRFLGDTNRCHRCRGVHEFAALGPEYVYLLGLYLGDGHISEPQREVYKLRLFLDAAYPEILREASQAIGTTRGRAPGSLKKGPHCVEVYSFWRQWPCFFPQHGSGLKHERPIELSRWQRELAQQRPDRLLRGLIHSDGCRSQNTGRSGSSHPRYSFKNRSNDIHTTFRFACEQLGLRWTAAPETTYISRKADVAELDRFIGPKR
jgi:hypothetical protein